jgi:hypothetical protein
MLFRVESGMRLGTTLVDRVIAGYGLLNLGRISFYVFVPPSNDLFRVAYTMPCCSCLIRC